MILDRICVFVLCESFSITFDFYLQRYSLHSKLCKRWHSHTQTQMCVSVCHALVLYQNEQQG